MVSPGVHSANPMLAVNWISGCRGTVVAADAVGDHGRAGKPVAGHQYSELLAPKPAGDRAGLAQDPSDTCRQGLRHRRS